MANYLGFAQAYNNLGNPIAEGLNNINTNMQQNRLISLREATANREMALREQEAQRAAEAQGIQKRISLASLDDAEAQRQGFQDAYKVGSPREAYAAKYRAEQDKAKQDASMAKLTAFQNLRTAVAKEVQEGLIKPEESPAYMKFGIRSIGLELPKDLEFSFDATGQSYYSGPINKDAYIDTGDGEYTTYGDMGGGTGMVKGLKITGWAEDGRPILQMSKDTVVEQPKGEYKDRTRPEGTGTVFEESYDGGKTWKVVSKGVKPPKESSGYDPVEKIVASEAVKDLPKLRREARTAESSKTRIDQMLGLLKGGNAGGLQGNILSSVAKFFDTEATSEAELYKKLASAGAGQLRASVIGPGQVSNYEQQLLQSVSGGGAGARSAVVKLMQYYKQEADKTINNYDDALESAGSVAPSATKAFEPIGRKPASNKKPAAKDPLGIL